MEVVRQTSLPQADPQPVLESSGVKEAEEAQKQRQTVLVRDLVVEEVDSRTCRHLQAEVVL